MYYYLAKGTAQSGIFAKGAKNKRRRALKLKAQVLFQVNTLFAIQW